MRLNLFPRRFKVSRLECRALGLLLLKDEFPAAGAPLLPSPNSPRSSSGPVGVAERGKDSEALDGRLVVESVERVSCSLWRACS